ncbi:hypothetical protein [Microlunatus sp. GCM10028923]|uniref:hypothetical protein n=1 Tax=Microlunatus sp. GCM10028923 TaxID=3273400 RepID=UPI003612E35E
MTAIRRLIEVLAFSATMVAVLVPVDAPVQQPPPARVAQTQDLAPELARRTEPACRCGTR